MDGEPLGCDHPIRWFHRVAAWSHERIERMTFIDREKWHRRLPDWVCEAYERIEFGYPCWVCVADREREYGATIKTDDDVRAKFPCPGCGEVHQFGCEGTS